jgi:hypothetical protein
MKLAGERTLFINADDQCFEVARKLVELSPIATTAATSAETGF